MCNYFFQLFNINISYLKFSGNFLSRFKYNSSLTTVDIKATNWKTKQKILQAAKQFQVAFLIFFLLLLFYFSVINYNMLKDDTNLLLLQQLVNLEISPTIMVILILPGYLLYEVFHVQTHILILTDFINKLDNGITDSTKNKSEYIRNYLKSIFLKRMEIQCYHKELTLFNQIIFTMYILNAVILSIGSVMSFFLRSPTTLPGSITLLVYAVIGVYLNQMIQEYRFTVEKMDMAIFILKWYKWDVKCQKFYLLLYKSFFKEFTIPIFYILNLDREFLKTICHLTYTFSNFLYTIKRKQ
ncbi:hypothetical protein ABEB36_008035 [Hypothenemus hampei]|uniref:Odorant receptor n=1 Tax=Hypothenemus hampei TaxID=57062 RepID=A0ABD1EKG8_HYPHA